MRSPLSLIAISALLAACNATDNGEPNRYQAWADKVATIPLTPADDAGTSHDAPRVTLPLGEKPDKDPGKDDAKATVKVELMSPHQLWDARNGPVKLPSVEISEVSVGTGTNAPSSPSTPPKAASSPSPKAAPATGAKQIIQLGAFSSEASAREAWSRLISGANRSALVGLTPHFDPVTVNGRELVRLRVQADGRQASILCQSVAASDPWCQRPRT